MAVFPHSTTRDVLESYAPEIRWRFYARTRFSESSSWQQLSVEQDWNLEDTVNSAAVLRLNPVNASLAFSDEADRTNRIQLGAEIKLTAEVGGVEETRFLGEVYGVEPQGVRFALEVHDDLAKWNTTGSEFSLEADTVSLPTANLVLVTRPGYTGVYGIEAVVANAAAFYGEDYSTPAPRRPWAQTLLIVRDAAGKMLSPEAYRIIPELGLIQITQDGTVPATISGVTAYLEDTLDLGDVIKALLAYPTADGGLGYGSEKWTINRECAAGCTTSIIQVTEGVRHLFPRHLVTVSGEARRIASRSLADGTLTLETPLSSAPAAGTAISYDTLNIGQDLQTASWEHGAGSNMDFWQRQLRTGGETVILRFNPGEGVYELLRWGMPPVADYALADHNRVVSVQPRNLSDCYTRFVATGEIEQPENICTLETLTHVLGMPPGPGSGFSYPPAGYSYPGAPFTPSQPLKAYINGQVKYWDSGYDPDDGTSADPCGLFRWFDGNGDTCVGWHNSYDREAEYMLCRFDFGSVRTIRCLAIIAANSQRSFPYTYTVEVSTDGSAWSAASPALTERQLNPGQGLTVLAEDISNSQARYLRVLAFPEKDGATNNDDPFLGLGGIAAYETIEYTAVARIQDTDPAESYRVTVPWAPYYQDISTYYPAILERLGGQHRTAPVERLGGVLNQVKAEELMLLRLDSAIRLYQTVKFTHTCDPHARIGDCVTAEDPVNGNVAVFVERINLTAGETVVEGTNYDAEVLP